MSIVFTDIPGKVTLLQATGGDDTVACSAVVADVFNEKVAPFGRHEKLVDELPRDGHWGCLDHAYVTFLIETPITVARQILRASNSSFNERSMRYLEAEPIVYMPRTLYTDVKRKELGSAPTPVENEIGGFLIMQDSLQTAWDNYNRLLELGVRKEQARGVLPMNMYTRFWMSAPLSDMFHFLNLRLDSHAMLETQYVANLMYEALEPKYPRTVANWNKYGRGPINEHGTVQTP